jgi:hypothetical protein
MSACTTSVHEFMHDYCETLYKQGSLESLRGIKLKNVTESSYCIMISLGIIRLYWVENHLADLHLVEIISKINKLNVWKPFWIHSRSLSDPISSLLIKDPGDHHSTLAKIRCRTTRHQVVNLTWTGDKEMENQPAEINMMVLFERIL